MNNVYDPRIGLESKVEWLCFGTFQCGCRGQSQQQDLTEEEEEEDLHVVPFSEKTTQSSCSPLKPLLSKLLQLFYFSPCPLK